MSVTTDIEQLAQQGATSGELLAMLPAEALRSVMAMLIRERDGLTTLEQTGSLETQEVVARWAPTGRDRYSAMLLVLQAELDSR